MLEYTLEPGSKEHKQCKKLYQPAPASASGKAYSYSEYSEDSGDDEKADLGELTELQQDAQLSVDELRAKYYGGGPPTKKVKVQHQQQKEDDSNDDDNDDDDFDDDDGCGF